MNDLLIEEIFTSFVKKSKAVSPTFTLYLYHTVDFTEHMKIVYKLSMQQYFLLFAYCLYATSDIHAKTQFLGDIKYSQYCNLRHLKPVNNLNLTGGVHRNNTLFYGHIVPVNGAETNNSTKEHLEISSRECVGFGYRQLRPNGQIWGGYAFYEIGHTASQSELEPKSTRLLPVDTFIIGTVGVERVNRTWHGILNLYIPVLPGLLDHPKVSPLYLLEKGNYVLDFKVKSLKGFYKILPSLGIYGLKDQSHRIIIGGIFNLDYLATPHFTVHFKSTVDHLQGFKHSVGITTHYHRYYNTQNNNTAYKLFNIPIECYDFSYPSILENETFENHPHDKSAPNPSNT